MKVGDLVKNTHAVDQLGLGIIIDIDEAALSRQWAGYLVSWFNAPKGVPKQSWSTDRWLEKVNDYR